jgi:hypothetical protein
VIATISKSRSTYGKCTKFAWLWDRIIWLAWSSLAQHSSRVEICDTCAAALPTASSLTSAVFFLHKSHLSTDAYRGASPRNTTRVKLIDSVSSGESHCQGGRIVIDIHPLLIYNIQRQVKVTTTCAKSYRFFSCTRASDKHHALHCHTFEHMSTLPMMLAAANFPRKPQVGTQTKRCTEIHIDPYEHCISIIYVRLVFLNSVCARGALFT